MSDYNALKKETAVVIKGWFLWLVWLFVKLFREIFSKQTKVLFPKYALLSLFLLAGMFVIGFFITLTIFSGMAVFSYSSFVDVEAFLKGVFFVSLMGAGKGIALNLPFFPITFVLLFVLNKFHAFCLWHIFFVCAWCSIMPLIWGEEDMVILFSISGFFLSLFSMTVFRLAGESLGLFQKKSDLVK